MLSFFRTHTHTYLIFVGLTCRNVFLLDWHAWIFSVSLSFGRSVIYPSESLRSILFSFFYLLTTRCTISFSAYQRAIAIDLSSQRVS